MDHCVIETPAGRLCIWEIRDCVTECAWVNAPLRAPETPLLKKAAQEVDEYFRGERKEFDLPLAAPGSELDQKVRRVIMAIPYGKTMSAAKAAQKAGLQKKLRAVIASCNKNPVALFIPCHRVTAEDGEDGYVGGAEVKRALWKTEGIEGPGK